MIVLYNFLSSICHEFSIARLEEVVTSLS